MLDEIPADIREKTWPQLEQVATGRNVHPTKAAQARAEMRRRETEQREKDRQLDIETAERIARMQIGAAERVAKQQLPVARASAWAAGFAAFAALILAGIAPLDFLAGRQ